MVKLCTLGDLRDQANNLDLEKRMLEVNKELHGKLDSFCKSHQGIIVVNNGSSSETRRTIVLDPNSEYRCFPPDIDLNIVSLNGPVPEGIKEGIHEIISEHRPKRNQDHKHDKVVFVWPDRDFNITLAIFSSEGGDTLYYTPELSDRQRLEAKALKLALQRSGAYGKFNYGISGIATEEMVRQYETIQEAFRFLKAGIERRDCRRLMLGDENLIERVSRHTWRRIGSMVKLYEETGQVRAEGLEYKDWDELIGDKYCLTTNIACSPASCGREGFEIAYILRGIEKELGLQGFEAYLVPYQGKREPKSNPHTVIYGAASEGDEELVKEFKAKIKEAQES